MLSPQHSAKSFTAACHSLLFPQALIAELRAILQSFKYLSGCYVAQPPNMNVFVPVGIYVYVHVCMGIKLSRQLPRSL